MRISDWSSDVCSSDLLARRLRWHRLGKGGGIEVGVSEQSLDDADVDAVLEQVGGKAVAQGVRPDALVDIGRLSRLDDDAVELAGADRGRGTLPREEPALRKQHALLPSGAPPVAQQQEQAFGQHGIAVASAFTALDTQQHALAVDIADLER